mgnify:CR=1 FL=1|tara:strand:- start:11655 stop:12452 length:798 start_codon:yes stop_codon:yes gene_type:complete
MTFSATNLATDPTLCQNAVFEAKQVKDGDDKLGALFTDSLLGLMRLINHNRLPGVNNWKGTKGMAQKILDMGDNDLDDDIASLCDMRMKCRISKLTQWKQWIAAVVAVYQMTRGEDHVRISAMRHATAVRKNKEFNEAMMLREQESDRNNDLPERKERKKEDMRDVHSVSLREQEMVLFAKHKNMAAHAFNFLMKIENHTVHDNTMKPERDELNKILEEGIPLPPNCMSLVDIERAEKKRKQEEQENDDDDDWLGVTKKPRESDL